MELSDWLTKYKCHDACMESTGKYWIPVFNIFEKSVQLVLAHPKYTMPQRGNKTDRKDVKWICDLFMCDMIKPTFIPPAEIRHLKDLARYQFKLTCMLTGEKNRALNYRRIKYHRGHKKTIIAICCMLLLTAIWHILTDLKPYSS